MHMAAFPTGIIGYVENPVTAVKPSQNRPKHLTTMVVSVVHTYHPEKTEPMNFNYQDKIRINS